MTTSSRVTALELSITDADVVVSHSDGVDVSTRDGVMLRLDSRVVDRIVKEHLERRLQDEDDVRRGWQPSIVAGDVA